MCGTGGTVRVPWGAGQIVLRLVSRLTLGKANDLALQMLPGEPRDLLTFLPASCIHCQVRSDGGHKCVAGQSVV